MLRPSVSASAVRLSDSLRHHYCGCCSLAEHQLPRSPQRRDERSVNVVNVSRCSTRSVYTCGGNFLFLLFIITRQIVITFRADLHGPQRMIPNDFSDPLTFGPAPPSGQNIVVTTTTALTKHCWINLLGGFLGPC